MPYIDVNQKRLNYSDSHPNGPPAGGLTYIFIHGLGSSQNYYGGVIPHLTPNHRCIAIDTYGSGRSAFTGLDQSIDTIADDVVKVMDGLKVSKAVLVGHSMGGTTVLQFAAKYGDRVVAVVAIGPVHPTASTGQVFEKRIQIVSEGMYLILCYCLEKADLLENRWNGTNGQHNPQRSNRLKKHRLTKSVHPRTHSRPIARGIHLALQGHFGSDGAGLCCDQGSVVDYCWCRGQGCSTGRMQAYYSKRF